MMSITNRQYIDDLRQQGLGRCSVCKEIKSLTADFYRDKSTKSGYANKCRSCCIERQKSYRASDPERTKEQDRRAQLKTKFGITPEQYDAILDAQNGRCGVCGTDAPGNRRTKFCVDHDHTTGVIRGLLCADCNMGLGKLGDSTEALERALHYLRNGSVLDQ